MEAIPLAAARKSYRNFTVVTDVAGIARLWRLSPSNMTFSDFE
ncbi:hypothetical protein [Rhizobium sp. YS-1r]|nr:hypothetical protein [Rhizobium sp. YS-1r]